MICEKCGKEPAITRVICGEDEQKLLGLECLKEFHWTSPRWNSVKDMIDDLYRRYKDPNLPAEDRKKAKDMIDELWRAMLKGWKDPRKVKI